MLRHIESHFIITDKDTSDAVEANLKKKKKNTINGKSLKCCSLVGWLETVMFGNTFHYLYSPFVDELFLNFVH